MTLSKPKAETRTTRMRDREFSDENWSKLMADAKQEAIEFLVNRNFVTDEEALGLAELSLEEIRGLYDGHAFGDPVDVASEPDDFQWYGYDQRAESDDDLSDLEDYEAGPDPESDDDPYCVCGVARSEHTLCGCAEGFQSAESWKEEREQIRRQVFAEDSDSYRYDGDDDEEWLDDPSMADDDRYEGEEF